MMDLDCRTTFRKTRILQHEKKEKKEKKKTEKDKDLTIK